jgi:hypothetical protein
MALIIVDYFSKETEIKSVKDLTSESAIDRVKKEICDIKGTPEIIIADSAKQFLGKNFEEFCNNESISMQLIIILL